MIKHSLLILASWLFLIHVKAQLPVEHVFEQAYTKHTRDKSGAPGKNYWQNKANYDIKIDFNPTTRLIKGQIEATYFNNSPDTLKELWFKLYPNLYKKGVPRKSKINTRDLGEGVKISLLAINNKPTTPLERVVHGTNMHLNVSPIPPGKETKLTINYSYTLNKGSHVRTGQVDEGAHFIAYFFPRVAVYDDIDGWDKHPYNGAEEFYNDFCNFDVAITVPKNFMVWATGDLTNAKTVLHPIVYKKLIEAEKSDTVIDVIDVNDLTNSAVTANNQFNVFKYEAKNVVDFAFATSNHYLWKATSLVVDTSTSRRTRAEAVFNEKHKDYFEVVDFAKKTVEAMSFRFPKWPFPYSHITVFDGLDQMEYPMMVNDNPLEKREDVITLTDHEIFHTMFPFYMGINETKYGWMDEGWATIGEWLISRMIDSTIVDDYGVAQTAASSGSKDDTPIVTPTFQLAGVGTFTNSYPKPGLGYLYIKDYLGDALFEKALHHYINNWNGKHPMPHDFFNSMNTGSGKNLNWFWQRWFFGTNVMDMSLKTVVKADDGYKITVENNGKPLPIYLTITFNDDSHENLHQSIVAWENGNNVCELKIVTQKEIAKIELANPHVPDKHPNDNIWLSN